MTLKDAYFCGLSVLQNRVVQPGDAVMFDIDDTLIMMNGSVVHIMVDLLDEAMKLGYFCVIMTARPGTEENVAWTVEQLKDLNIKYSQLIFAPMEHKGDVKVSTGYNYILSVGDMPTDLTHSQYWINTSSEDHNCGM